MSRVFFNSVLHNLVFISFDDIEVMWQKNNKTHLNVYVSFSTNQSAQSPIYIIIKNQFQTDPDALRSISSSRSRSTSISLKNKNFERIITMKMKLKYCILHFTIDCTCGLGYSNRNYKTARFKSSHIQWHPFQNKFSSTCVNVLYTISLLIVC